MAYFKVLFQPLPRRTEGNPVSRARFEFGLPRY